MKKGPFGWFLWGLAFVLVVGVALFFVREYFRTQIDCYFRARTLIREHPQLAVMPRPLPDLAVYSGDSTHISRFGYEFDLPWTDGVTIKESLLNPQPPGGDPRQEVRVAELSFKSGISVKFYVQETGWAESAGAAPEMREFLGENALASNYNHLAATLNAKPSDLSLFVSQGRAARYLYFLSNKASMNCNGNNEFSIFQVQSGKVRGVQFSGVQAGSCLGLMLFDEHDRPISFEIELKKGAKRPTQPKINRIIQSLRPAEQPQPGGAPAAGARVH